MPRIQASYGLLGRKTLEAIISGSGSFRAENSWLKTLSPPNSKAKLQARVLPHRDNLRPLQAISELVWDETGRNLTVVVYPETPKAVLDKFPFRKVIQPTPESFAENLVFVEADLDKYLQKHGAEGFCFDDGHSRFLWRKPLFETVIRRTRLVHISVGRTDVVRRHTDSIRDLHDILTNKNGCEISEILTEIQRINPGLTYVIETPMRAVATGRLVTKDQLAEAYKPLAGNIRNILAKA